jgi:hypothetical protein
MADFNPNESYYPRWYSAGGEPWATWLSRLAYASGWGSADFTKSTLAGTPLQVQVRCDGNASEFDTLHKSMLRWKENIDAGTYTAATLTVTVGAAGNIDLLTNHKLCLTGFDGVDPIQASDGDNFLATKLSDDVAYTASQTQTLMFTLNAAGLEYLATNIADLKLAVVMSDLIDNVDPTSNWANGRKDLVYISNELSADPPVLSLSSGGGGSSSLPPRRRAGALITFPNL